MLTYNDLGVELAKARLHDDAVRWLDRAIEQAKEVDCEPTAAFHLNRADCHRMLGHVADALADLELAREISTHDPQTQWDIRTRLALVHNDRGMQLFNHAEPRRAAVEFSRAIECNPKVAQFYTNRAEATVLLSRYELVRDDLLHALRLSPNDKRAQELLSRLCPG